MADEHLDEFLHATAHQLGSLESHAAVAAHLVEIAGLCRQPFNLAVVGRMKAGKSTLINGILGASLVISDVEEATATLNWICKGSEEQLQQFEVALRDGTMKMYPLKELHKWTGKREDVLARIRATRFLRLFSNALKLEEIQIIDTPGTGSAVEEHEIARDFLNPETIAESIAEGGKADAIIYVIPPVGREQDAETLEVFASTRFPNSGPYNSIGVLHKWDALGGEFPREQAKKMALRLREQFDGKVADVIPVSGPLALAARSAPDTFFSGILSLTNEDAKVIESALRLPDRWAKDPRRQSVRDKHPMPWPSFKLLVQLCLSENIVTTAVARQRCLEESGIEELESFLRERFFSQSSIIKQCQLLNRTACILEPVLRRLNSSARQQKEAASYSARAAKLLLQTDQKISFWLTEQGRMYENNAREKEDIAIRIDRDWQHHRSELELLQMDLRISALLADSPEFFPVEHKEVIRSACNHMASVKQRRYLGNNALPSLKQIEFLINFYRTRENRCNAKERPLFEHLVFRFEQIFQLLQ